MAAAASKFVPHSMRIAVLLVLGFAASTSAQTRVSIRPIPKPEQLIHVTTRQEVLLRTGEKAEEPGPAQVSTNGLLVFTQLNGTFDAQDRMEAKITIERLELDDWMGGKQRTGADPASAAGRVVAVVFDRSGKLLSIKVPPDMRDTSGRLTQLLAGAYGTINFLPAVDLRVGEETTTASELPMRLPGNASPGPLEARVSLTLRAIEKNGKDRIARLQQRIDVATASTQVKITGGGAIDVNLDRGFVSATDTEWKFSGVLPGAGGAAQSPPFFGSIKVSVTAK